MKWRNKIQAIMQWNKLTNKSGLQLGKVLNTNLIKIDTLEKAF